MEAGMVGMGVGVSVIVGSVRLVSVGNEVALGPGGVGVAVLLPGWHPTSAIIDNIKSLFNPYRSSPLSQTFKQVSFNNSSTINQAH